MKVEATFQSVETDKPTGQTLTDVPELTWARVRYGHHQVCKRFRNARMQVWGVRFDNILETFDAPPKDYEVLEILERVLVLLPEKPPEPPAIKLNELDPWVWAMCRNVDAPQPRCHDGTGRVFYIQNGVPTSMHVHHPDDFTVTEVIGQLRIKVTDDE